MDTALRPHRDPPGLMRLPRPKPPCAQGAPEPSITLSFPTLPSLLLDKLRDFRREGRFCDVTVCVRSAERGLDRDRGVVRGTTSGPTAMMFRAHRVVLAAASPYFLSHAGLQTTGSEPSPNPLTLTLTPCPAIPPRVFHDILLSCYTGQLVFPESQVLSYLTAASYLHMEHVVTRCTHILHSEPRGGGANRAVGGANGTAGGRANGIVGGAGDTPSHNPAGPEAEYFSGIPDLPDGASHHHHHHQHQHHNHAHQQHHSTPTLLHQPQPLLQAHLAPPPTSPPLLASGLRRKRLTDESTEEAWQQNRLHQHRNNDENDDEDHGGGGGGGGSSDMTGTTTTTSGSKETKADVSLDADCGGDDGGGGGGSGGNGSGTGDADDSTGAQASDDSFGLPVVVAEIKCEFEEPPFLIDQSGRMPELSSATVGDGDELDANGGDDDDDDSGNDGGGAEIADSRLCRDEGQFGDGAEGFDKRKPGDDGADAVHNGQHGAGGACDDSMGGYGAEEVDGTMAIGGAGAAMAMDGGVEDGGGGRMAPGFGGDFTCYLCGKVFRSKQGMRLHLEVHAGLKRHTCHVCGRSFGRKQVLAYHLTTHTGLKPFECGICGRRFPVRATLRQHLLRHHQQPAHGHAHTG
ncbi:zinc finger and BTB domain-containing protein 9-like [Lethenteron reissneri]|uniref:zinc finger and BTB domain-containing protein 9-like n=1 Tax=Lethenteron reissneri TaxID=7753 RepID=UPI002AB6CC44|nr:zinc finger and BTB domain-containing protein 9-like [Lethenteron reissneri]